MPNNIALNKNAFCSSFVAPYSASRAVDGSAQPIRRWLCNSLPGWLAVDLGAPYWIGSWAMVQMNQVGWPANYASGGFSFQVSTDSVHWNTVPTTNWQLERPVKARFARVYFPSGMQVNNELASVVELVVYDAPLTSGLLSNLVLNDGATLSTDFSSTVYTYDSNVGYAIQRITVTPTAEDPRATITVNGQAVASGADSQSIELVAGQTTPVTVVVTPYVGDPVTYTVNVTRAAQPPNLFLTKVTLNYIGNRFSSTSTIDMDHTITEYTTTVSTKATQVTLTPVAEDDTVTITINNSQTVSSGQTSTAIDLSSSSLTIPLKVSKAGTSEIRNYTVIINKV